MNTEIMIGAIIAAPIAGILLAAQKIHLNAKYREALHDEVDRKAATQARLYAAQNAIKKLLLMGAHYTPINNSNRAQQIQAINAGRAALGYDKRTGETK